MGKGELAFVYIWVGTCQPARRSHLTPWGENLGGHNGTASVQPWRRGCVLCVVGAEWGKGERAGRWHSSGRVRPGSREPWRIQVRFRDGEGIISLSRGGPGSDLGYRRVSVSGTYPKLNFLLYSSSSCLLLFFFSFFFFLVPCSFWVVKGDGGGYLVWFLSIDFRCKSIKTFLPEWTKWYFTQTILKRVDI